MSENNNEQFGLRMYTGCTMLDILLGGEKNVLGFEPGITLGIQGASTAGKTFVLQEILQHNLKRYKKQFKWIKDDIERGDKFNTMAMYGVELSSKGHHLTGKLPNKTGGGTKNVDIIFDHSNTCEEMDAHLSLFLSSLKENELAIYSVDSLDALSSAKDTEVSEERFRKLNDGKEVEDAGSYNMDKQKFLATFFREKAGALYDKHCTMILTMQEKDKMAQGGMSVKGTSNGQSTKFYCSTMLDLKCISNIVTIDETGKDMKIGARIQATTRNKARCSRPGRIVQYVMYFNSGLDNIGSNIDYLFGIPYDYNMDAKKLAESPVCWGGEMPTLQKIKEWVKSNGVILDGNKTPTTFEELYKVWMKQKGERAAVNCDFVWEWAHEMENNEPVRPKIMEAYDKVFGKRITRQELWDICANNKEERMKLKDLVIAKWEAKEDALLAYVPKRVDDID